MLRHSPTAGLLQWTLRVLHRLRPAAPPADEEPGTARVGREGEDAAYFFLRRRGYVVVARRWITALVDGEVDLIAWHENTLCFIEVKTRSRRDAFPAEFAIDEKKQQTLRRMADAYLRRLPLRGEMAEPVPARFDVVSVYLEGRERGAGQDIRLVADAFR